LIVVPSISQVLLLMVKPPGSVAGVVVSSTGWPTMTDWFFALSPLIVLPFHLITGTGRTTGAGLAVADCCVPLLEGLVTVNVTVSAGAFLVTFTVAVIWVELTTLTLLSVTALAPSVTVTFDGPPASDKVKKQFPVIVMSCCSPAHHPLGVTEVMVGAVHLFRILIGYETIQ
jgi:hypothetical protein